jgi:hypothetical protein
MEIYGLSSWAIWDGYLPYTFLSIPPSELIINN